MSGDPVSPLRDTSISLPEPVDEDEGMQDTAATIAELRAENERLWDRVALLEDRLRVINAASRLERFTDERPVHIQQ